ncbi:MAG: hypothetical protein FWH40_05960 [Coriobacteriia bacterium]|nr:hypothetical protein [Coriobacteriia bacterium]
MPKSNYVVIIVAMVFAVSFAVLNDMFIHFPSAVVSGFVAGATGASASILTLNAKKKKDADKK